MARTPGEWWRFVTLFAGAIAVGAAAVYVLLPWRETTDFDILGLLWVVINAQKLGAGALGLLFGAAAIFYGLRWLRDS